MTVRAILFVCLGNICRSPTAEAVFARMADRAGLRVALDSAGTGDWHIGEPPHPPMVAAARARGYDLSALRARQLVAEDFSRFDRIFVMDRRNLIAAERRRQMAGGQGVRPELFLDLVPECGHQEMPDPWYTGGVGQTIDLCGAASRRLLAALMGQ